MFRRKEENGTDSLTPGDGAMPASPAVKSYSEAPSLTSAPQATQAAAAPAASNSTYVPTAPSAARAAAPEAARASSSAPAAPAASYRPSPIAEFNRGAARPAEAPRTNGATAAAPSFGSAQEKAPSAGKSNRRVLTVGNDILLKGEIATCDRLVIEGRVEAKLSDVHTVEIAECGSFKGTAEVEDAEISGIFEGDLVVRNRLVIYTTGEVRGNIGYGEIEIERGGKLTGQIKTVAAATAGAKAKTATAVFDADKAPVRAKETAAA